MAKLVHFSKTSIISYFIQYNKKFIEKYCLESLILSSITNSIMQKGKSISQTKYLVHFKKQEKE